MRLIEFTEKNVTMNGVEFPADSVSLVRLIDDSEDEKIYAIVKIFLRAKKILLFEGEDYKPLNEFTDEEIDTKIVSLI